MVATAKETTATGIATPSTDRETKIGYTEYTEKWREEHANSYWKADHLYLRLY